MDDQLILDRYRLIERIAVGGSAEVWRAHDEQLDRPVAVKRLHPHLVPDEASRKRLGAEARAAAGLAHPVIVDVYDVDLTGESAALVMELVEGESLSARLAREGPLPERAAASVTADLAEALYHAHQRGVIHRDVKPGNVLLATDGRTRLVDFGIAHSLAVSASAERLTVTGTVIGTLHAMAPEQLSDGPITPRTDLYGLGVVLHEALTGRPPYPAGSPVAIADAQRAGPPVLADVDPALAAVTTACLAYDPAERPLHAGAVASALRSWLAGDSAAALAMAQASAGDTSAVTRPMAAVVPPAAPAAAAASADAAAADGAPVSRHAGTLRLPRAVLLAAALLAVLGLAVLASGGGPPGTLGGASPTLGATPPVSTPTPSPTPRPSWLDDLVIKIEEACGPEIASDATAALESMEEEDARKQAEELIKDCDEERGGGNGGGPGNGGGGGGRGGGGGDD